MYEIFELYERKRHYNGVEMWLKFQRKPNKLFYKKVCGILLFLVVFSFIFQEPTI